MLNYSHGKTALLHAVENEHVDTVRLLIQKGANVETKNERYRSIYNIQVMEPLHFLKLLIKEIQLLLDCLFKKEPNLM